MSITNSHWSELEVELLKAVYFFPVPMSTFQELFGRSRNGVTGKAHSLGLEPKEEGKTKRGRWKYAKERKNMEPWTEIEDHALKICCELGVPYKTQALLFRRAVTAVRKRASEQGCAMEPAAKPIKKQPHKAVNKADLKTLLEMLNENIQDSEEDIVIFTDKDGQVRAKVMTAVIL